TALVSDGFGRAARSNESRTRESWVRESRVGSGRASFRGEAAALPDRPLSCLYPFTTGSANVSLAAVSRYVWMERATDRSNAPKYRAIQYSDVSTRTAGRSPRIAAFTRRNLRPIRLPSCSRA